MSLFVLPSFVLNLKKTIAEIGNCSGHLTTKNLKTKILTFVAVMAAATAYGQVPMVFDKENTADMSAKVDLPGLESLPWIYKLPDPMAFADGSGRAADLAGWERRRSEIMQQLYHYEIGAKPATPRDSIEAWMDADTLCVRVHANGRYIDLHAAIQYPDGDGPFPAMIGVMMPYGSLPPEIFRDRGVAGIAFRFTEVTSHTQVRGDEPINTIYPDQESIGSYSAWPWGVSRIIDGLEIVGEKSRIDLSHIGITGCSFAGKMALFSGALDERITLTIAQEPGGGGAAAWRVSDGLGWVETLERTNYSWFLESMRQFANYNVYRLPIDHHEVVALIAPRAALVLGNTDYEWLADESGYVSCQAARTVWAELGVVDRMGFSIVGNHPHCMLPECQYGVVEAFVDRFLLGKDVPTDYTEAAMFSTVDYQKWVPWTE